MSEARRMGVRIKTPNINHSHREWRGCKNEIRMGLMSIKRLKKNVIKKILSERKSGLFESLDDFLFRVDMDLSDAMALTNAQCFSSICGQKNYREVAYIVAEFYLQTENNTPINTAPIVDRLTKYEMYQMELDVFGYPISIHPLEFYRPILSNRIGYAKDIPENVGRSIYLLGVYITRKETRTSNKEPMEFLTLEDETDIYECVLFPKVLAEFGDILHWETLFIIRGKVEQSFGICSITINKIASLKEWVSKTRAVGFS
jgi:error-prone DNA polymerase